MEEKEEIDVPHGPSLDENRVFRASHHKKITRIFITYEARRLSMQFRRLMEINMKTIYLCPKFQPKFQVSIWFFKI